MLPKKIFSINDLMNTIITPETPINLNSISLSHPEGRQGGSFYTKILYNQRPLYFQTSKSLTRQGVVKTGKKYYCDLMFDMNTSASNLNMFECLEEKCIDILYKKSDIWFANKLDKNDIELAFNPIVRTYKSGKKYLIRVNIKGDESGPNVTTYNENEESCTIEDLSNESEIISVLEMKGLKFTSKLFQIDLELKQLMILDSNPEFKNCIIKQNNKCVKSFEKEQNLVYNSGNNDTQEEYSNLTVSLGDSLDNSLDDSLNNSLGGSLGDSLILPSEYVKSSDNETMYNELSVSDGPNNNTNDEYVNGDNCDYLGETNDNHNNNEHNKEFIDNDNINSTIKEKDIILESPSNNILETQDDNLSDLVEVDLDIIDENLETIKIIPPSETYFKIYKEIREKAKDAKKNAIKAYLEAKQIKNLYMLDDISDSDSDIDTEINKLS